MATLDQPNPRISALIARVERALGAKPPRAAAIQLGPLPGVDLKKTTAYDPKKQRHQQADRWARLLGLEPWEQTRLQRYRDYREIDEEVPELSRGLSVYVDFVFGQRTDKAFEIRYSPSAREEVKRVNKETEANLDLHALIRAKVAEGIWLGDSFTELVFASDPNRLAFERHLRPEQIRIMTDEWNMLHHYEWTPDEILDPRILVPFQVLHYAPDKPRGSHYGRSKMHSARGLRRKHEAMDDVTVMLALKKAAGDSYWVWPFPGDAGGWSDSKIDAWIQKAQESVDFGTFFESNGTLRRRVAATLETIPRILPYRVIQDLDTKPQAVEMKPAALAQLVEVLKHFQERYFVALGIPKALVGIERDVNARATLEIQGIHFAMTLRNTQRDAAKLAMDVYLRGLLAQGIVPKEDEFFIDMPEVSSFDEEMRAKVLQLKGQAVSTMIGAKIPIRWALQKVFDLDEQELGALMEDIEEEIERLEQKQADQQLPPEEVEEVVKRIETNFGILKEMSEKRVRIGDVRPPAMPTGAP